MNYHSAARTNHYCHAKACTEVVPPKLLMCGKHWRMVPKRLKDAVWATYRPGQEITKDPSVAYIEAAMAAVDAVARKEGRL